MRWLGHAYLELRRQHARWIVSSFGPTRSADEHEYTALLGPGVRCLRHVTAIRGSSPSHQSRGGIGSESGGGRMTPARTRPHQAALRATSTRGEPVSDRPQADVAPSAEQCRFRRGRRTARSVEVSTPSRVNRPVARESQPRSHPRRHQRPGPPLGSAGRSKASRMSVLQRDSPSGQALSGSRC